MGDSLGSAQSLDKVSEKHAEEIDSVITKRFVPPILLRDTLAGIEKVIEDYSERKLSLTEATEQYCYLILDAIEATHIKEISPCSLTIGVMGHIGIGKDVLLDFLRAAPICYELTDIIGAKNGRVYSSKEIAKMSKTELTSLEGLVILDEAYQQNILFTDLYSKGLVPYRTISAGPAQDCFRNDRAIRDMLATVLGQKTALFLNRTSIEDAVFTFVNILVKFKDDRDSFYNEHDANVDSIKKKIHENEKPLLQVFSEQELKSLEDACIPSYMAVSDLNRQSNNLMKNYLGPFLQHALLELAMYDGIIFLDCPVEELLRRVDSRDRREEEWLKHEDGRKYYRYLHEAYQGLKNALIKKYKATRSKLLIVDASEDISEDIDGGGTKYDVNPENQYLNIILERIKALQLDKLIRENRITYPVGK